MQGSYCRTVAVFVLVSIGSMKAIAAPHWHPFKNNGCRSVGIRTWASQLMDIVGDWTKACAHMPADVGGQHFNSPSRCINNAGMWGEFDVSDPSCRPHWLGFSTACTPDGTMHYSAQLMDIVGSWEDACATMPADIAGRHFDSPTHCTNTGISGELGEYDVPDPRCYVPPNTPSPSPPANCGTDGLVCCPDPYDRLPSVCNSGLLCKCGTGSTGLTCNGPTCTSKASIATRCSGAPTDAKTTTYVEFAKGANQCFLGVFPVTANSTDEARTCVQRLYPGATVQESVSAVTATFHTATTNGCAEIDVTGFSQDDDAKCANWEGYAAAGPCPDLPPLTAAAKLLRAAPVRVRRY